MDKKSACISNAHLFSLTHVDENYFSINENALSFKICNAFGPSSGFSRACDLFILQIMSIIM
jgi:hypothetical protein